MALPSPSPRKLSHTRTVVYSGFQRGDGLWDIEANLTDIKPYAFIIPSQGPREAGHPVHEMNIRLTIDNDFKIHDVITDMVHIPHPECSQSQKGIHQLIGSTLSAGWRKTIAKFVGGTAGCTHLNELLFNMATAAYQTVPSARQFNAQQAGLPEEVPSTPPHHVGKCMSWAFDGPVTQRYYPMFYRKAEPQS